MDAEEFYHRARIVLGTAYDYAIYQYLCGLDLEPDNVAAHEELREIALERTAKGGKPLGLFEKLKATSVLRSGGDDKGKMLAAERLLAYEPEQRAYMQVLLEHAVSGGFNATAAWIQAIIRRSLGQP